MYKKFLISLATLCSAATLSGCNTRKADSPADVKPRAKVEIARARLGTVDQFVKTTGSFQVLRDEKVKSTISGKVERVFVLEGDEVVKGQALVTVLSQESYAAISGATEMLSRAANSDEKRQAEEALKVAEQTAAVAKIVAPFSGVVIQRLVTEGELVNQGTDLVEMIDPESEYFVANVPLAFIPSVHLGQPATISVPGMNLPGLRGTVLAINPSTDPNSQSLQVRIGFRRIPKAVAAGTFGNVAIKVGERNSVILVPKSAVYHDDELDKYFVWRVQGDSLALLTQVSIGLSDSSYFQITSGISTGDVVATVGGYGLPDSTAVSVINN